jgi:hypothetical protein
MFILTFSADNSTNKLFEITSIMGINVEIKPFRKCKLLPQCKQCQAYGHTQRYCNKDPRCVKCAGNTISKNVGSRKKRNRNVYTVEKRNRNVYIVVFIPRACFVLIFNLNLCHFLFVYFSFLYCIF